MPQWPCQVCSHFRVSLDLVVETQGSVLMLSEPYQNYRRDSRAKAEHSRRAMTMQCSTRAEAVQMYSTWHQHAQPLFRLDIS